MRSRVLVQLEQALGWCLPRCRDQSARIVGRCVTNLSLAIALLGFLVSAEALPLIVIDWHANRFGSGGELICSLSS